MSLQIWIWAGYPNTILNSFIFDSCSIIDISDFSYLLLFGEFWKNLYETAKRSGTKSFMNFDVLSDAFTINYLINVNEY